MVAMDFPYPPPLPPLSATRSESPSRASIKSGRSVKSMSRRHIASATRRGGNGGGDDVDAVSVVDEGDFDEAEERRLMPMYMRQSEMRKGNSRKALKWLGLA